MFCPSVYPASARPRRNAATRSIEALADVLLRNPTTGIAACCARAASGHAAAPPSSVMNSRRLLSNMELPVPWVTARIGHRTAGPRGRPEPFGIVPDRPSLHEVTISHTPGVD